MNAIPETAECSTFLPPEQDRSVWAAEFAQVLDRASLPTALHAQLVEGFAALCLDAAAGRHVKVLDVEGLLSLAGLASEMGYDNTQHYVNVWINAAGEVQGFTGSSYRQALLSAAQEFYNQDLIGPADALADVLFNHGIPDTLFEQACAVLARFRTTCVLSPLIALPAPPAPVAPSRPKASP